MTCDKRPDNEERFNIRLTLTGNNPQVRTGRDRSVGIIRDSTGNDGTVVSIGMTYDRINYTVIVNLKQSSYEVMEDGGEVMIMVILNKLSSNSFLLMINLINDTADGK